MKPFRVATIAEDIVQNKINQELQSIASMRASQKSLSKESRKSRMSLKKALEAPEHVPKSTTAAILREENISFSPTLFYIFIHMILYIYLLD